MSIVEFRRSADDDASWYVALLTGIVVVDALIVGLASWSSVSLKEEDVLNVLPPVEVVLPPPVELADSDDVVATADAVAESTRHRVYEFLPRDAL